MKKNSQVRYNVKLNVGSQRVSSDQLNCIMLFIAFYYLSFVLERGAFYYAIDQGNHPPMLLKLGFEFLIWLVWASGIILYILRFAKTWMGVFCLMGMLIARTIFFILIITKFKDTSNLFSLIMNSITLRNGLWAFSLVALEIASSVFVINDQLTMTYIDESVDTFVENNLEGSIEKGLDSRGLRNASVRKRIVMNGQERPLHGTIEKEVFFEKD